MLSAVGLDEGGDRQSHGRIVGVGVWSAGLDAQGIFTAVLFVGDGDCTLGQMVAIFVVDGDSDIYQVEALLFPAVEGVD